MITIKNDSQIEKMRKAGELLHSVLEELRKEIEPGVTTLHLDQMAEKLIRQAGAIPSFKGYDGFPRTVDQARALDEICAPDAVVDIDVPDEMLLARLTGRRVCSKCSGTFHVSKLADENVCPVCGDKLYQREDDKPATISNRLNVYHEQTAPLIGYYAGLGRLKRIDGNNRPEDVFQAILASLE